MAKRRHLTTVALVVNDVVAIYIAIVCAYYTRVWLGTVIEMVDLDVGLGGYLGKWWILPTILVSIAYHGGYNTVVTLWDDFLNLLRSFVTSFLLIWVVFSLQKEAATVSRIIVTLSFVYMALLVPAMRCATKFLLFRVLHMRIPALLCETDDPESSRKIEECLSTEWYSGYEVTGRVRGRPVPGDVDTCLLPIERADEDTIKTLKPSMKNLIIVSDMPGLSFMSTDITTFFGKNMNLITIRNGLLSFRSRLVKNAVDVMVSTLLFLITLPLLGLVSILILIDSRGPIIYSHRRCGKGLREFSMLKFRTMYRHSDDILREHLEQNPEALAELEERNKLRDDPRVTRVGRLLRRLSLDELPQLINVMKGEMSLVGPRPDSKDVMLKYHAEYSEIWNFVKPGITGLWQVSGRSEIEYDERVKLDYIYMLNWSLWLDFVIVLKTFWVVLIGKGAY